MSEIRRTSLFNKLGPTPFRAIESAVTLCKLRGNPYVELAHWTNQLLQAADSDWHHILPRAGVDLSRLASEQTSFLDRLPRGATAISDFAPQLEEAVERGWVYASLLFENQKIRSGHLLVALLKTPNLRSALTQISRQFEKIKPDLLTEEFSRWTEGSCENKETTTEPSPQSTDPTTPASSGALARFSVDLTGKAEKGEIDPVLGRDEEIRQIIDILMRRRQNNPILTGEAGVGKTAVVEGFAVRIASGDVPPPLKGVRLHSLDLGLLQAGAGVKGEFENRLKQVIEEIQNSPTPIILFIDEAHTLVGAGGTAGQGDAANLMKPALARGTLKTIAATTWAEYKKYFEKDPALTRRFQVIKVEEPTEDIAVVMIRSLAPILEKHHRVRLLDEALIASVQLSHRYIPARQLPDKAVSLIDTACARVAISISGTPPELEDLRRRKAVLETEKEILLRESQLGSDHSSRIESLTTELSDLDQTLANTEARWQKEKDLVEQIFQLREAILSPQTETSPPETSNPETSENPQQPAETSPPQESLEDLHASLKNLEASLLALQGEHPLILPQVDTQAVASVVADWTGIPVGRMVNDQIQAVLHLAENLEKRVLGQTHALKAIAERIQTSRAGLTNPGKPVGVFLLAGPSGVGKTETALALAESLFGGEGNMITINMSEFQEAHTVSTLKGAPPGYVGYGEGGVLTEAVRRRPYSVILLDEVEKAHSDVHEIFFQVFDKGMMEDGEGRMVDFKNTIILLTTNVGSDLVMKLCQDPELAPDPVQLAKALRPPLLAKFPAALLGRMVTIPYYPLGSEVLHNIITMQLDRIAKRMRTTHSVDFQWDESVVAQVASRCTEMESGGRMVDAILTQHLLPEISRELLNRLLDATPVSKVIVSVTDQNFSYAIE